LQQSNHQQSTRHDHRPEVGNRIEHACHRSPDNGLSHVHHGQHCPRADADDRTRKSGDEQKSLDLIVNLGQHFCGDAPAVTRELEESPREVVARPKEEIQKKDDNRRLPGA